MQIRRAEARDFPGIAKVHAASWKDTYKGMLPAAYLRDKVDGDLRRRWETIKVGPKDCVLVAVEDAAGEDDIVGFIAVWMRDEPFIDNLHAAPSQRSRGIGARLMDAAAAALLEQGETSAHLWVIVGNERALAFYKRLGGEAAGTSVHDVFGNPTEHYKVQWRDLSVINHRVGA